MKKIIILFMWVLLMPLVLATTNLDFRLDVEEKGFYPNEKIPLNVTVINRDASFAAKDAELIVNIGDRFYTYDLGDLEPGEKFQKEIILPEFPAGTQNIKGEINYTGILDERFIEISYGSFEVLFPPIERYPRNVYVSGYDLPDKIIGGKSYDVSITITNDGEVDADLLIEFGSVDEFFDKKSKLKPGESTTVKMAVKFENPGVSLIEARAYALINGEKYLLNYRGKKTYVQAERNAKLIFDRIEMIGEGDNEINQEDSVKFKIFIKNEGDAATDVKAILLTDVKNMNITDSSVSYVTIVSKDSVAPDDDFFGLETENIDVGAYGLNLKLSYVDSEEREKEIQVQIKISEGGDSCTSDNQCSGTQRCEENKCVEVECGCGYVQNRECVTYECCKDNDCGEFNVCNSEIHKCVKKTGCLQVLYNGDATDKADFLIIGAEYTNALELKDAINSLFSIDRQNKYLGFFDVEPFKSNRNKFNIWMIPAPDYTTNGDNSCSQSCSQAIDFSQDAKYISQCPQVDSTITIFKNSKFRSCAGGGQWSSLSCQDNADKGKLILHETGHSFGHLADEYVEYGKGSRPWGPNCADDESEAYKKWGELVGKQDIGLYEGCSYTDDNVRPTKNSLMKSHYSADSYGLVNEIAIINILEGYK